MHVIVPGVSEFIEDGEEPFTVRASDTFVLKLQFAVTGGVDKPTRKIWVSKN